MHAPALALLLALGQFLGPLGGMDSTPYGGSSVVFQASFSSSGPLIADDANTVAHVTFNGSALVDSKGNVWTQNGTVPQVSGATASPLFPSGFGSNPRSAAGPFSGSNYYSLGSGSDVLDFAADFSMCVVYITNAATNETLFADGYYLNTTTTACDFSADAASDVLASGVGSSVPTPNGVNVCCAGRAGSTSRVKFNLGTMASGTQGALATGQARIGLRSGGTLPASGSTILELWASSTTPTDALFTAIQQRVFAHIVDTGQALTVSRASTATYTTNGRIWTAPTGVLRVESSGAVIEPSVTNIALQSEAFDNATWTKNGITAVAPTVTANATTAPDNNVSAERVDYPAVGGGGQLSNLVQAIAVTNAVTYTFSVYAKAVSGTPAFYIYCTNGGAFQHASTPTLCQPTTSGWTRCTNTFTSPATETQNWGIGTDTRGAMSAQSAGSVYLWGAQVEALAFASSYVPTVGTSVTRSADVVSATQPLDLTGPWCAGAKLTPYGGRAFSTSADSAVLAFGNVGYGGTNTADLYVDSTRKINLDVFDNGGGVKTGAFTLGSDGAVTILGCDATGTLSLWANGSQQTTSITGAGTGLITAPRPNVYLGTASNGASFWTGGYLQSLVLCYSSNGGRCQ